MNLFQSISLAFKQGGYSLPYVVPSSRSVKISCVTIAAVAAALFYLIGRSRETRIPHIRTITSLMDDEI